MGEVFLADQLGPLGPVRPVALKRLLPALATDRDHARLFLEEMALAAQLNHPNIATTYDFGEIDGDYFLAMEYVEGLSLNRIIESVGPLPAPVALEIVKQIADALAYAHAKRSDGRTAVVHQDVSPHNVMISRDGAVKLLDFGIARAEAAVRGGLVRGKAAYAAPEQLRGAAPDRRFDVWSLGVVLFECLAGRRPFEGADDLAVLRAAENGDHPRLSALRPEVEPFEALVERALQPNPERRWSSADAFRTECLRLSERFGAAKAADLGLLVERAGGLGAQDDVAEISGTGVAALGLESRAVLSAIAGERTTRPTKPRRRWPLWTAAVSLGLIIGGVAVLRPEEQIEAPRAQAPPEATVPVPVPVRDPDPLPVPLPTTPPPPPPPVELAPPKARAPVRRKRPPPPPPPPTTVEGFGKLSVRTDPTWAQLLLDGQPIGRTILYGRPFDPGTHRLQMQPGDDAFAPIDTTITIKSGVTTNVFANFQTREVRVVER